VVPFTDNKQVHESFRSENVLFFPAQTHGTGKTPSVVDYSQPWVLGFEFSRPEGFFSAGLADFCPARDVYRHPERQGRPEAVFNKLHDIYALGVVLLEIGTSFQIIQTIVTIVTSFKGFGRPL